MGLVKQIDHVTTGLANLIQVFRSKSTWTALLTAILNQVQDLEDAFFDLIEDRWLDTAVGVQLDGLGKILGREREGLDDDTYRARLKMQVGINVGHGATEEILNILVLYADTTYEIHEYEFLEFGIELLDQWTSAYPTPDEYLNLLLHIKPAGYWVWFHYTEQRLAETFRFADGDTEDTDADTGYANDGQTAGGYYSDAKQRV